MKNTEYKLLTLECAPACPAVLEKEETNEIVVIGTLLSPTEEAAMKKSAKVGIAPHERVVRIPREVFDMAVEKILAARV